MTGCSVVDIHEADGSPFCAEDLPTCGVEVGS